MFVSCGWQKFTVVTDGRSLGRFVCNYFFEWGRCRALYGALWPGADRHYALLEQTVFINFVIFIIIIIISLKGALWRPLTNDDHPIIQPTIQRFHGESKLIWISARFGMLNHLKNALKCDETYETLINFFASFAGIVITSAATWKTKTIPVCQSTF